MPISARRAGQAHAVRLLAKHDSERAVHQSGVLARHRDVRDNSDLPVAHHLHELHQDVRLGAQPPLLEFRCALTFPVEIAHMTTLMTADEKGRIPIRTRASASLR